MRACRIYAFLCSLLLLLHLTPLYANDIQFTGFGTAAIGTLLGNDDEPFVADPVSGGVYDGEIRFDQESMVAVRAIAQVNEQINAVVQITAKGAQHYEAAIEWAYVEYQLNPETKVTAGRYRLPLYFYSDFLDTGFAYHWIRPPTDLYSIPVSTLTGVNVRNTHYFGSVGLSTQIWYGAEKDDAGDVVADITKSQGINLLLEYDWLRFRLVHHTLQLGIEILPFIVDTPFGLIQVSPEPFKHGITFQSAAFMADWGNFIWRSEYTNIDNEGNEDEEDSAYGSIAYRIGDWTPHYTYSYFKGVEERQTHTLGVRWDFAVNTSLKFEYANQHYETDGGDTLVGPVDAGEYRTEALSIALDFIF